MGRPSKLTDAQWQEIGKRLLAGESVRKLAKEFGVSPSSVQERFSERNKEIKKVADQLSKAEMALSVLPVSAQISARSLADELKSVSQHLAGAARFGAMTAHRLSSMAHLESDKIDDTAPLANIEALKTISAFTKMANESSIIGLGLLKANHETVERLNEIDITPAITQITRRIVRVAD